MVRSLPKIRTLLLVVLAVQMLSGCSTITDFLRGVSNSKPPKELEDLENKLRIEEIWSKNIGEGNEDLLVNLQPAVQENIVYVSDIEGLVSAIDVKTGNEIWQTELEVEVTTGVGVQEDILVIGTANGEVIALNTQDGSSLWQTNVPSEVLATPAVDFDIVVVRTVDGKIIALDKTTGDELWFFERAIPLLSLRGVSQPILYQGAVIVGLDNGRVVTLDYRNGRLIWERRVSSPKGRTEIERIIDLDAQPLVKDNIIYFASFLRGITAIEVFSGNFYWQNDVSSVTGFAIDTFSLYVIDENSIVYALDLTAGREQWRSDELERRSLTAPAISDTYLITGDFEGYLHWFSTLDGSLLARVEVDDEGISATPLIVSGIDIGLDSDLAIVLARDGTLAAYTITESFE